jgi:quinoprotein glucose dehydrogenase
LAAPPILGDITVAGKKIKAVTVVTKSAMAYVFDRVTGEPVWPIEERPVPQSDVPGEKSSPTQPFPTKPLPFDRHGLTEDDLIDFTPELRAEAIKIASEYKMGPVFSPPIIAGANGKKATLTLPSHVGGANWQGGAFDPATGMLYVASLTNQATLAVALGDPKRTGHVLRGVGHRLGIRARRRGRCSRWQRLWALAGCDWHGCAAEGVEYRARRVAAGEATMGPHYGDRSEHR